VTFRNKAHIALVTGGITKNKDGNITSFKIVHSTSSKGPIESTIMVDGSGKGYDGWWDDKLDTDYVYQWDSPEKSTVEVKEKTVLTVNEPIYDGGSIQEVTIAAYGQAELQSNLNDDNMLK
jgi:hypothetical protein